MVAPADSVAALRPLGAAELLDEAVRVVKRNARASFTIAAPFAVVISALNAAMQLATFDSKSGGAYQQLWSLLVGGVFGTVLTGMLAPVYTADLLGRRLRARESVSRVGSSVGALLVLAVAVGVAEEVGLLLLVVGGVWLWGIWAVAAPALVVERTGPVAALKRSVALVKTSFWRTWGVRALGWVVTTVLRTLLTLPFVALATAITQSDLFDPAGQGIHHPGVYVTILAVGQVVATLLTAPITSAVESLLYVDLRMRREGMDIVLGLPPAVPQPRDPAAVTAW